MKILAALLLTVALVLAPYTVELELGAASSLPWKTFSESAVDSVAATMSACPVGGSAAEVLYVQLVRDGQVWLYFYAPDSERFLFARMTDGAPVEIFTGVVDMKTPGKHDVIPDVPSQPYNPGSNPCDYLFPKQA
jgi:hypothetical protein